jgi:hypothetical protein
MSQVVKEYLPGEVRCVRLKGLHPRQEVETLQHGVRPRRQLQQGPQKDERLGNLRDHKLERCGKGLTEGSEDLL